MIDNKGFSEETCIRCGWVMGMPALNCNNDDTPHVFPSQQAENAKLREKLDEEEYVSFWLGTLQQYGFLPEVLDDRQKAVMEKMRKSFRDARAAINKAKEIPGICGLCGNPMPEGETMFQYHGFSGPCPPSVFADDTE